MHRVLATIVTAAMLAGCGDPRAAYNASADAHDAAAAGGRALRALDNAYERNADTGASGFTNLAPWRAANTARAAADAVGTGAFYADARTADTDAATAWREATRVFGTPHNDPQLTVPWSDALEASRLAWEAAERAKASHD